MLILSWILWGFYYGYIVFQFAAGFTADRVGGKLLVGGGILGSAFNSLLFPPAAELPMSWFGRGILHGF